MSIITKKENIVLYGFLLKGALAVGLAALPSFVFAITYNTGDVANDANLEPPGFSNIELVEFQDIGTNQRSFLQYVTGGSGKVKLYSAPTETGGGPAGGTAWFGIGKDPETELDVAGTVKATGFTFPTGAAADKVLTTADANGGLFWSGLGTLMQSLTGYSSVVGTNQVLKNVDGAISWGAGGTAEEDPTVETFAKTALPACDAGQVLYASGGALSCVTDSTLSITEGTGISITGSGASRTIAISQEFLGSVRYQGTWDASSNAPSLSSSPAASTKGHYYVVSAAGAQFGVSWGVGDYIISNGAAWQKIDNTDVQAAISAANLNTLSDVEISSPQANQVLQYVSGVWKNQTANFSPWTTVTGTGIKYTGGKVGIGATIADADIISPLTVQGEVAAGSFTTAGMVSAGGGARFPRQAGTNVTPGRGPSISLESPSNNVTTSKGTPDFCDEIGECSTDNTPSADLAVEYVCPIGSGGLSYSRDIFKDASNNNWHQTITCVAGTDSYSLSTNAGTLEFTNTSGAVKLNLNQNGNVSFFGSLIIPGGSSGNVLTKNADGTASWQPSASGADNWGTQVVQTDASLKGNGTTASPLGLMACSSNGQILKWNGTTLSWGCDTDNAGTGGDNLGNHTATQNIKLNNFWLSNDGGNEGLRVDDSGSVGIGTASPTGKLHINSTQNVTQADATIYNSDSNTVSGLESGHPIQIGDYITLGGQGPFLVTSRGGTSVDINDDPVVAGDTFSGTIANQNSYSLIKRNLLGGGNTYAGNIITGKVDADTIQIRNGAAAGKFLKSTDASGNAVWDTVPPAYTNANVETWAETNLADGDFSASPSTAKIKSSLLPDLVITDTYPVSDGADADTTCDNEIKALTNAKRGDVAICATTNTSYILSTDAPGTFSNWIKLLALDSDADSTNEIQVISRSGSDISLSRSGGTVSVNDADADPINEAQTLTFNTTSRAVNLTAVGTVGGGSFTLPQGSKWDDASGGINYSGGNVGIGTASPTEAKLEVNDSLTSWQGGTTGVAGIITGANSAISNGGNFRINSSATHAIDVGGSLTLGGYYIAQTSSVDFAEIAGRKENGTSGNTAGYLQFGTRPNGGNMTETMRITSTGNVGIGVASPLSKLSVLGVSTESTDANAGAGGIFQLVTGTGINTDNKIIIGVSDTNGAWIQSVDPGTTNKNLLLNPNGGNVGIGTAPIAGAKLDVNGTTRTNGLNVTGSSIFENNMSATNVMTNDLTVKSSMSVDSGIITLRPGTADLSQARKPGETVWKDWKDTTAWDYQSTQGDTCGAANPDSDGNGSVEVNEDTVICTGYNAVTACYDRGRVKIGGVDYGIATREIKCVATQGVYAIKNNKNTLEFVNGAGVAKVSIDQSGTVDINGGGGYFKVNPSDGGLELKSGNDPVSYIDFHRNDTNTDFDGRILFDGGNFQVNTGVGIAGNVGISGALSLGRAADQANEVRAAGPISGCFGGPCSHLRWTDGQNYLRGNVVIDGAGGTGNNLSVTGNVGIGTASPGAKLDVVGTAAADYLRIDPQDGINEGGEIQLVGAGSYGTFQIDNYQGNARIHTLAPGKQFQVIGGGASIAGNVGIGGSLSIQGKPGKTDSSLVLYGKCVDAQGNQETFTFVFTSGILTGVVSGTIYSSSCQS